MKGEIGQTARKRGKYRSLDGKPLLLRLPADLRAAAQFLAREEGITEAEWWRRAGQRELRRAKVAARREQR